jgi:hypothetical protein
VDQEFSSIDQVRFVPADRGSAPIWIGLWIVLALFAPAALTAGIWTLGPFVEGIVKQLRGG